MRLEWKFTLVIRPPGMNPGPNLCQGAEALATLRELQMKETVFSAIFDTIRVLGRMVSSRQESLYQALWGA